MKVSNRIVSIPALAVVFCKWLCIVVCINTLSAFLLGLIFKPDFLLNHFIYWEIWGILAYTAVWLSLFFFRSGKKATQLLVCVSTLLFTTIVCGVWVYRSYILAGPYPKFVPQSITFMVIHINLMGSLILSYILVKRVFKWIVIITVIDLFLTAFYHIIVTMINNLLAFYCILQGNGMMVLFTTVTLIYAIQPKRLLTQVLIPGIGMLLTSFITTNLIFFTEGFWPPLEGFVGFITFDTCMVGLLIYCLWLWNARIYKKYQQLDQEKVNTHLIEKKIVDTNLKLLQARLDPAFLVRILRNISKLLETDLEKAILIQQALIDYLRSLLPQIKLSISTLEQEIKTTEDFLNIYKAIFGGGLDFSLQVPENLHYHPFPPLFLIALIEAVAVNGLEENRNNISIRINGYEKNITFLMEISVTGDNGFYKNTHDQSSAFMLPLKERINALYGENARLALNYRPESIAVELEIPLMPCENS